MTPSSTNGDVMNGALRQRAVEIIEGKVEGVPDDERQMLHFRMTMDIYDKLSGLPLMWLPPKAKQGLAWFAGAWVVWVTADLLGLDVSLKAIIAFLGGLS